jgi:hypothetical protein
VQAERSKQQGRRFPLFIFDKLTSTLRLRVSGFLVAFTQRTHSQRAIGVISFHTSWISCGAAARAVLKSCGTFGSGQPLVASISSVAVSPALMAAVCCSFSSTLIQWPRQPSGSSTVLNPWPLIVPCTATCPRDGSFSLASSGNRRIVRWSIVCSVASKRIVDLLCAESSESCIHYSEDIFSVACAGSRALVMRLPPNGRCRLFATASLPVTS